MLSRYHCRRSCRLHTRETRHKRQQTGGPQGCALVMEPPGGWHEAESPRSPANSSHQAAADRVGVSVCLATFPLPSGVGGLSQRADGQRPCRRRRQTNFFGGVLLSLPLCPDLKTEDAWESDEAAVRMPSPSPCAFLVSHSSGCRDWGRWMKTTGCISKSCFLSSSPVRPHQRMRSRAESGSKGGARRRGGLTRLGLGLGLCELIAASQSTPPQPFWWVT